MKKWMKSLIAILVILSQCLTVGATGGSGNLDGGGGGMGTGSSGNVWSSGNEGVRVTVVDAQTRQPVTTPIDFSNQSPSSTIYNFGKVSKISYNNGQPLRPQKGGFHTYRPNIAIPKIISSDGTNNIEAIKRYFTSEYLVMLVAQITGMNYQVLISGRYKLLLEPFAFYKFQGVMIATTATEAAMYDEILSGGLRSRMVSLSHKNLPLAMFLEVGDLGYPAWGGSRTSPATNAQIKSSLGIGIVRFTELVDPPKITGSEYEYRVNTEVITAVIVSGGESNPNIPTTVTFDIQGTNYHVGNVYYPDGEGQLAWVKWTTPSTPQEFTISVTANGIGGVSTASIKIKVIDLEENPPPNPTADDRNDSFARKTISEKVEEEKLEWSIWTPTWKSAWYWIEAGSYGQWVDRGEWIFQLNQHIATIKPVMEIVNDRNNPTGTDHTLKSGYGIEQTVTTKVVTTQASAVSNTPNAISYFPEFHYETYWRLLERTEGGTTTILNFKQNSYSTFHNRVHFTPIWMPDGEYEVHTWLLDYWTPVGMLSMNLMDQLEIEGNLWQDWHIGPM